MPDGTVLTGSQAISALRSTVSLVDSTLAGLRSVRQPPEEGPKNTIKATEALRSLPPTGNLTATAGPLPDAAKDLITSMSADKTVGLGGQTQSLKDMATAIKPIVDRFDDVLVSRKHHPLSHV